MRHASLAYALILLLLSAALDDVWAATTPETTDDAQAALNNDYLRAAPHPLPKRPADSGPPMTGALGAVHAGRADPALVRAWLPGAPEPSLLYLFMSLRR